MKNFRRTLATGAAVVALCIGFPTNAHATDGTFTYISDNQEHYLDNPGNGRCYELGGEVTELYNDTDAEATVFGDAGCQDAVDTVGPGGASAGGGVGSVRFTAAR
ncbi:hypothetical protein ACFVSN_17860 [Kitasatospora sp. NPDC057904]|uniref:hypothetical protein n=1 Tax=Kitasatospora sp. NPDC057904 TaxID=3346275 RepID=UPI0036D7E713